MVEWIPSKEICSLVLPTSTCGWYSRKSVTWFLSCAADWCRSPSRDNWSAIAWKKQLPSAGVWPWTLRPALRQFSRRRCSASFSDAERFCIKRNAVFTCAGWKNLFRPLWNTKTQIVLNVKVKWIKVNWKKYTYYAEHEYLEIRTTEQIYYGGDTSGAWHGQTRNTVPTSPEGAMTFFGNCQIIDNIGYKIKKN